MASEQTADAAESHNDEIEITQDDKLSDENEYNDVDGDLIEEDSATDTENSEEMCKDLKTDSSDGNKSSIEKYSTKPKAVAKNLTETKTKKKKRKKKKKEKIQKTKSDGRTTEEVDLEVTNTADTITTDLPLDIWSLLLYPLSLEDFQGPVIKPSLKSSTNVQAVFIARRGKAKEGVLDLRFKDRCSRDEALKELSGVKLCGEVKLQVDPHVIESSAMFEEILGETWKQLIEKEDDCKSDDPVSVFVNNIPKDTQVELFNFLFPSSLSIQHPVNSRGAVQGYAIIQFPNLQEARNVVENNKTYPAEIGGNLLNMYVIGHEEENTEKKGKPEEKKQSVDSVISTADNADQADRKRSASITEYSGDAKISKLCDSSTETKEGQNKFVDVFVGPVLPEKAEKLRRFLLDKLVQHGICTKKEHPIVNIKCIKGKNFQFLVFRDIEIAEKAILVLDGLEFDGEKLAVRLGDNDKDIYLEECTVVVSNAPKCDSEHFRNFFNQEFFNRGLCNKDENIVRKIFPKPGNVIKVVFFTETNARTAVDTLNGVILRSNILDIKPFVQPSDVSDRPVEVSEVSEPSVQPTPGQSKTTDVNTSLENSSKDHDVFVGSMPEVEKEEMAAFFKAQFAVRGICQSDENPVFRIKYKPGRNFQFLVFYKAADAETCIRELNGVTFKGQQLTISFGSSKRYNNMGGDWTGESRDADGEIEVYVGNLPKSTTLDEITQFIRSQFVLNGRCTPEENPVKRTKFRPERRYQFVIFHKNDDAMACVRILDEAYFKGSKLRVKVGNESLIPGPGGPPFNPYMGQYPNIPGFMNMPFQPPSMHPFNQMGFRMNNHMRMPMNPGYGMPTPVPPNPYQPMSQQMGAAPPHWNSQMMQQWYGQQQMVSTVPPNQSIGLNHVTNPPTNQLGTQAIEQAQSLAMQPVSNLPSQANQVHSIAMQPVSNPPSQAIQAQSQAMQPVSNPSVGQFGSQAIQAQSQAIQPISNPLTNEIRSSTVQTQSQANPVESVEDKPGEYHVYFGNVPACRPTEFLDFIKKEFRKRGLCAKTENPVKRLKFSANRTYQFAIFSNEYDAMAASEELNGEVFKGSQLTTKVNQELETGSKQNNTSSMTTQDDDSQCKVHIRNLPMGISQEAMGLCLRQELINSGVCTADRNPIKHMDYDTNQNYLFLQFYNITDAQYAVQALNGRSLQGHTLTVDIVSKSGVSNNATEFHNIASTPVSSPMYGVIVSNIPIHSTLDHFSTFVENELIRQGLCRPGDRLIERYDFYPARSYQYIMFGKESYARAAIRVLNGLYFMGETLKADQAFS